AGYSPDRLPAFYRHMRDTLGAIPGVVRVAFAIYSPMEGDNWSEGVFVEGKAPPPAGSRENSSSWVRVSDGYFEAIGTKLLKGRAFSDQDTPNSQKVAVVNQ